MNLDGRTATASGPALFGIGLLVFVFGLGIIATGGALVGLETIVNTNAILVPTTVNLPNIRGSLSGSYGYYNSYDNSFHPISGATLAWKVGGAVQSGTVSTDGSGQFSVGINQGGSDIELPAGTYAYTVSDSTGTSAGGSIVIGGSAASTFAVTITVKNQNGNLVQYASVWATDPNGNVVAQDVTSAYGVVQFMLPAATYTVYALGTDTYTQSATLTVASGPVVATMVVTGIGTCNPAQAGSCATTTSVSTSVSGATTYAKTTVVVGTSTTVITGTTVRSSASTTQSQSNTSGGSTTTEHSTSTTLPPSCPSCGGGGNSGKGILLGGITTFTGLVFMASGIVLMRGKRAAP